MQYFIVPSCDLLQNFCKNILVLENSASFCLIFVLFFEFIFFELMFCIMRGKVEFLNLTYYFAGGVLVGIY